MTATVPDTTPDPAADRSVVASSLRADMQPLSILPGYLGAWTRRHPLGADVCLAALFLGGSLSLMAAQGDGLFPASPLLIGVIMITWLLFGTAMALRRRRPVGAWATATTITMVPEILGVLPLGTTPEQAACLTGSFALFLLLGLPIMLGTLAARLRPAATWAAWLVTTVVPTGLQILFVDATPIQPGTSLPITIGLINAIGVLVGLNARSQRLRLAEAEARSARLVLAREQDALLAAATERSRIAREMHDVVAHSLAVMITMADGAVATIDRDPATAKQALEMLAETGRSALADTRRLVGVLRDDPGATSDPLARTGQDARTPGRDGLSGPELRRRPRSPEVRDLPVPEFAPPGTVVPVEPSAPVAALRTRATSDATDVSTGEVPLAPAPESSDLETLVDRFRGAGMPVTYTRTGADLPDDKGLQLTVYRIAQEAMTNILRYAPTTPSIEVVLERHRGTAVLTVVNDAAPGTRPMHGSGKGLIGMRERAAVYGGTVQAGPTATGWHVRAVLRWDEKDEGSPQWQMPA